ncbi:unnamed protein product, partial [marine sediment metagenome]
MKITEVYLDGTLYDGYANWESLTKEIVRNDELR